MPQTDYEIITKIVVDTAQAIENLQALNVELDKKKKDFKGVAQAAKDTSNVIKDESNKQTKSLTEEQKKQKELLKKREKAWEDLGKSAKRAALVIVAAIGLVLRKLISWMTEAAKASVEFQRSMYLFEVSIRALQRTGMETTLQEWRDLIVSLKEQFPIFSEQEIVGGIANATLKMREYSFTLEEMQHVMQTSALLARALGRDYETFTDQLTGALTRGYFEALQGAGINIGRLQIMQRALNEGIEGSITLMSESERAHLAYQILLENEVAIVDDLGQVTTRAFDRIRIAEADVADANKDLGMIWVEVFANMKRIQADFLQVFLEPIVIPNLIGLFQELWSEIARISADWYTKMGKGMEQSLSPVARALGKEFQNIGTSLRGFSDELDELARSSGSTIEIWRGADIHTFWVKAEHAVQGYTDGIKEALTTIQRINEETRGISPRYITEEQKQDLKTANEYLEESLRILEELTGLEFQIDIDKDTTLQDIDRMVRNIQREFIDEEGNLVLNAHLKLLMETGQVEEAMDEMLSIIGEGLDDLEPMAKEAGEDMTKEIEKAAKEMSEALSDIDVWFTVKVREAGIDLQSDLAKMARDLAQDLAKIQRDLSASIAKANADAKAQIAEKNRDYRNDELKEEEEYLRKMKYLREDFLMDLEEALRERDAKQIIRLTREYHVDARRMTEDYEAGKKDRANAHKDEIADITSQNNRKVAELKAQAKREAEERKRAADIAVEERKIRYQEEMDALDRQLQDKLEALAQEFADEYDLTADWLREFSKLLAHQYDKGSALYNYGIAIAQTIGLIYQLQQAQAGLGFGDRYSGDIYGPAQRYAEGGVLLATKPTIAVFGEAGPELVHFTPLADISATPNLSRTITDAGIQQGATITHEGGMSVQEQLGLEIWLQEGLEGRIIGRALDETTSVFDAVLRKR